MRPKNLNKTILRRYQIFSTHVLRFLLPNYFWYWFWGLFGTKLSWDRFRKHDSIKKCKKSGNETKPSPNPKLTQKFWHDIRKRKTRIYEDKDTKCDIICKVRVEKPLDWDRFGESIHHKKWIALHKAIGVDMTDCKIGDYSKVIVKSFRSSEITS